MYYRLGANIFKWGIEGKSPLDLNTKTLLIRPSALVLEEHASKDKSSHIYKHLVELPEWKRLSNDHCFTILDILQTKYQLKLS